MTDELNPFARCERTALLIARSFAMLAMDQAEGDEASDMASLGFEIQMALMAHRAFHGSEAEIAEA